MIDWIEAQTTFLIALIVFSLCYVIAAILFGFAIKLSRDPVGKELKAISHATLTPLAVIFGLLVGFLAARIWDNAENAKRYVENEASALSEALLFAEALPPEVTSKVHSAIKRHIRHIVTQEWQEMASERATPRTRPTGLADAISELLAFTPSQPSQQYAQQRAIIDLERAFEARIHRIRLSQTRIASIKWVIILTMAALTLATMAMFHIGEPVPMAAALFIASTAVAACLVLLMANDQPFGAGGVTISSAALREILPD
jgi:hypothetical protein